MTASAGSVRRQFGYRRAGFGPGLADFERFLTESGFIFPGLLGGTADIRSAQPVG